MLSYERIGQVEWNKLQIDDLFEVAGEMYKVIAGRKFGESGEETSFCRADAPTFWNKFTQWYFWGLLGD